ncbi:Amastin surface glycofamily protein [Leishmania donovani]|uniref:Cytosolic carboxypeptidase-like protein 5 n=1 Tax=Leishmania donovani TaxID=5661 RepID=A0A504X1R5_LEIDO|nr:Amastin surface glycofamily protein [Leishmania donovani]
MLYCWSFVRWVCLTLNIVGFCSVGITWGAMLVAYVRDEGPFCRALKLNYQLSVGFFLLLVAWVLDLVDIVFLLLPFQAQRSADAARQLRDDALVEEPAELILPCEESLPLATGFGGVVRLGARHGMQAEHRVSKGPDPRLASILPEVVRHSPRPPPVTHTTDVTASALEQEPGRAARLGRGMRSTRVRVAPTAQHVPDGGDEQGQDEPVRRMARLKGRQCVLGDQDVAVVQQRPPSPGLRHGAVAEVMGNATWPLVVGTDGGELCVAPERIVLRGPPRKLHHTARLLERASWLRCCAHGPRAVEAVALIPISRCWRGVGVNHGPPPRPLQGRPGGPLAHVGVRGAEGRLRCVVEALCVKRGREVCGDAVALACATVVCAISPMAAAGVRRLGLRMIATQHAVGELFAAVHECRLSAGRRTDEKLLRSVRRWGRTALHDPAQDVCVFHHKLFHSASRCCWPQARAFRREVSKMGCKFTFLVYAILQLIAFLSVLIGTPLDMFRGDLNDFGERPCVTLWGFKRMCYSIVYALDTDEKWATCHKRRSRFRMAEALAAISIMVYCAAFVLGVIMLFCCSLLRWVCLTLNVVGLLTLGITWVFMVLAYVQEDGVLCPALRTDYKFGYGFFLLLVAWVLDLVDIVFLLIPVHRKNSVEAARQLRDDALVEEPAELILPCEESLPLATGFGGVVRLGARHGMQAEHRDLKGPDPRLASILPEVVRHSPRPPPVTHTTDVTASALEQEPGRAARLGRDMRSTRVRVAPTAQHVPDGGDEQGQDEPVRRMARLKGRQCVLGDQDVAVVQQRPPSPGLRHGAVAEVMGNATWPLVVGTDGGELCVAPERIVLRGPPRKLHHTARLLERASWLRCCAHGPRAVEAVALIPISRALCRSAVRVEGGPLAHVGVHGAEGRLRCVVEALCVKRGREVCGDAVALACATVVCAISPIEAKSPFGVHNDVNVTDMGLGFSGCSQQSSPREAAAQRTSIEGHRDASRCISNSTKLHLTAPGPEVDDAHWVFQRPPNNQRTFYFQEDNLEFSSQFDSGNLIQVERVGVFHYRMYTAMDCGNAPWQTNNRQWFHFSVRGGSKGAVVTICFVGMAHSNMFTYDWMPVMAVVPTRPQYTRIAGKAHVEALEKMPETPGYPLLVHKPVSKDDADSDGGGDEGDNDADAGAAGANNNGGAGGIAFSISPTGSIAMNLTFNFKIETEIAVTYTPPQGRPDSPAIYIASNHPYTYYTLQRNLAMWQETARRSNTLREMSLQAPDHQARRSSSEQRSGPDSYAVDGLATVQPGSSGRSKKWVGSFNTGNVAVQYSAEFSEIYFHREVLCKSLEGRDVTLLTISDCSRMAIERAPLLSKEDGLPHSSALGFTQRPYSFFGKQYVVLTARVHPGECPGSHLMHGCIDFLMNCTDCRAAALRHNFVFCVVPMLNPDGVVRGHSRVDSNGVDLNRMYRDPSRKRHPAPYAVLALLRSLGSRVALFIDMHAHANKRGTFFYGNSMDWANQIENLLYAKLVSLNTPYLDFRSCNFSEANMFAVSKSGKRKDSSSRVVAFTEAGIVHGYTIETSHVMADALNPSTACYALTGTFRDTARAMLLGLLDLKGINPKTAAADRVRRDTFAQAFKLHGKEAQASTSESGNTLLATIMKSMAAEDGVRSFVPLDTAIVLLSQTVPTGPPRSLLYGSGNCGAASGAAAAGGTGSKGGGSAQRRGTSPSFSGNNCTTAIPPAVIATRRRSKPMLLSSDTTVET